MRKLSRRGFLKGSAAAVAATKLPRPKRSKRLPAAPFDPRPKTPDLVGE